MDNNLRVMYPREPLNTAWMLNTQWRINLSMFYPAENGKDYRLQFNAIIYWAMFDLSPRSYGFNRFGSHDGT